MELSEEFEFVSTSIGQACLPSIKPITRFVLKKILELQIRALGLQVNSKETQRA